MSRLYRIAALPVIALAASASYAQDSAIRVGGSTTALPIISTCAANFMEKYSSWDKADASLAKDQTVIYVTGGGSGFGVKGLMNGTIEVGMVSRDLKDSEIKSLNQLRYAQTSHCAGISPRCESSYRSTDQGRAPREQRVL